jgi:hypothetical protein
MDQNLSNSPSSEGRQPYGCVHPSSGPVNSKGALAYVHVLFSHVRQANLLAKVGTTLVAGLTGPPMLSLPGLDTKGQSWTSLGIIGIRRVVGFFLLGFRLTWR